MPQYRADGSDEEAGVQMSVLRWTGMPQLYSFYRHIAFNAPRFTTGSAVLLLLGIGAIRLYLLLSSPNPSSTYSVPAYLTAYFALVFGVAVLASVGMLLVRLPTLVKVSWAVGGLVALATFAMYLVSRTIGLPGLPELVGRWDYPLGTFGIILSLSYLGLHLSVVTGLNVAMNWRSWHD